MTHVGWEPSKKFIVKWRPVIEYVGVSTQNNKTTRHNIMPELMEYTCEKCETWEIYARIMECEKYLMENKNHCNTLDEYRNKVAECFVWEWFVGENKTYNLNIFLLHFKEYTKHIDNAKKHINVIKEKILCAFGLNGPIVCSIL
jgi:hypothetical protein